MSGSFSYIGIHFIFSTKNRANMINNEIKDRLYQTANRVLIMTNESDLIPAITTSGCSKIKSLHSDKSLHRKPKGLPYKNI